MIRTENKYTITAETLANLMALAPVENLLIFDIETTGFHRNRDHVVSITALLFENQESSIIQWFAESAEEEKELLLEVKPYFDNKSIHVTYNGHSFDIPFLRSKYNNYNISISLNKSKCYDLYRFARKALTLESYTLKNIERALGIHRLDKISGKECVDMYQEYLRSHNPSLSKAILDHNYEDVTNLIDLFPLVKRLTPEQLNQFQITEIQFYDKSWFIEEITLKGHFLEIKLWAYANTSVTKKNYNLFLPDGLSIVVDQLEYGQYACSVQIPFYEKELPDLRISCVDLSSIDNTALSTLEPYQLIVKCNGIWLYNHLQEIISVIASQ